jgi:hypothetical protein
MSVGAPAALRKFRPSYKRAAPQQAVSAIVCFVCGVSLALLTQHWLWLLGVILVGAVVPFTFIFTMAPNRLLLDEAKHPRWARAGIPAREMGSPACGAHNSQPAWISRAAVGVRFPSLKSGARHLQLASPMQ